MSSVTDPGPDANATGVVSPTLPPIVVTAESVALAKIPSASVVVTFEREMSQVQEKYKHAEENYGSELLNLVVAKGYLKKLMENEAIRSYVTRHASEILEQFELVLNTVSMEEAVEQAEREDGPGGPESGARTHPKKDNSGAASDPGMNGQLG